MKKNKIIGLLIAAAGSVASISTAAALYVKASGEAHFGIGAKWKTLDGTVNYLIKGEDEGTVQAHYLDADGKNGGEGFGGVYTQAEYDFPLGASFSDDVPAQQVVVGNFKVELSSINAALQNKAKIWVCVDGYVENSQGESLYKKAFMSSDVVLEAATYSVSNDIAVKADGSQTVKVYIKLNEALTEAELISLAESKAFDIEVTWGAPSDSYTFAYVVGNKTMWKEDGVYAMVPDIDNTEKYQWMFENLPASMEKTKCHIWHKEVEQEPVEYWSLADRDLNAGSTYDVYWSGGKDAEAYYVEHTA